MNYKVEYILKCAESLKGTNNKSDIAIRQNKITGMLELLEDNKIVIKNLYPIDYSILTELQLYSNKKNIRMI